MMDKVECLKRIAKYRTDEVVITMMGVSRPWAEISNHELDLAWVGSAMGHAADFGFGLALACPDKKVVVLNGDGSMLMSLGTLVTISTHPPSNLILIVVENGTYEVTGNQPIPGEGFVNFATIAKGSGFDEHKIYEIDKLDDLEATLPKIFKEEGPIFAVLKVKPEDEPPPIRRADHSAKYIRQPLAEDIRKLKAALTK
jgi:thiamine pyrophosphate-dependent acetolactate synthase large subunit-like protein